MPPSSTGQRFEAELADGFPACDNCITITPALALVVSVASRSYGLLWSLAPFAEQTRTEPMAAPPAG